MKLRLEEEDDERMKMSFPRRKLEWRKLLSWIFLFPPTIEQAEAGPSPHDDGEDSRRR